MRPPQQGRSQQTLERIVSAAESLIREKGLDGTSVSEIAARADVSVGSFYARFPSKESLLQWLDERIWEEARTRWDQLLAPTHWEGAAIEDVVREIVRVMVRGHRKNEDQLRALGLHACTHPDATTTRRTAELNAYVFAKVRELLLKFRAEMTHPDPALATEFGF